MTTRSDLIFHKSSYSQGARENCVEVAEAPDRAAIRDTQNRGLGHLEFQHGEWAALLGAIRADRL
jgi:hypothetical protein